MVRQSLFAIVIGVFALGTPMGARAAIVKNISTGIDPTTGLQLANNASDPDWVVATGGDGAGYVGQATIARSTPLPAVYQLDSASTASRWIAINSGIGLEGFTVPGTHYNFQTTVDLTGFDPSTANIPSGRFAVDDGIIDIRINGTAVSIPGGSAQGLDKFYNLPANLGSGLFIAGVNTITFELLNNPSSPQALRLEGSVVATPEPASLLLIPALGLFLARTRRA